MRFVLMNSSQCTWTGRICIEFVLIRIIVSVPWLGFALSSWHFMRIDCQHLVRSACFLVDPSNT